MDCFIYFCFLLLFGANLTSLQKIDIVDVASIVSLACHLSLVVFPIVIYLFIHPLSTISLHISILYCMTVLVVIMLGLHA